MNSPPHPHPHVIILPFPAQGHIKPMLILANLLTNQAGFTITFINSEHNHRHFTDQAAFSRRINFISIPDGLPSDHPRSGPSIVDLFFTIETTYKPILKNILIGSMNQLPRPTCIISDGIMSFAIELAAEIEIPSIAFRTYSATCTWVYFHLQKLIDDGEIPVLEGNKDMDNLISTTIPGLENIMRRRDLPNICRLNPDNPILQFFITQTSKMTKASSLILNTFQELESPIISHLNSIFPTVYTIGPLHAFIKHDSEQNNPSSLMQTDKSCIKWLDAQQPKSVLYVSFGTVVVLSREELMEFWYGLVNSGKPFLWAIRPNLIWDESGPYKVPEELKLGTEQRGFIVGWGPQEEILAHDSVGGFLTHSGWNSILESIWAGKPMICWPRVAEQQVNSRCVCEMWGVGVDMKDTCDRSTVENMVIDLMDGKREGIVRSTTSIARLAQESILEGGSSYRNINKLIEDIKLLQSSSKCIV